MVKVKRRSKQHRRFKIQTFATVSIGCAGLWLVSEPLLHTLYQNGSVHSNRQQNVVNQNPLAERQAFLNATSRNSLLKRDYLRTSLLHDLDPLLEIPKSPNALYAKQSPKELPKRKRVVQLQSNHTTTNKNFLLDILNIRSRKVDSMSSSCCDEDTDYVLRDFERKFYQDCTPIVDVHANPNCNTIHEISLHSDIHLLSTKGSWRSVWKVQHHDAVLKLLALSRDFDQMSKDSHASDAMVMDRLTASPYVVNAFGYCSQSVSRFFSF